MTCLYVNKLHPYTHVNLYYSLPSVRVVIAVKFSTTPRC